MGFTDAPPPFALPWAALFWAVYVWTFYIAEAAVVRHTKTVQASASAPPTRQDGLGWLSLLSLAAKLAALALAWWQVGVPSPPLAAVLFGLGLAALLAGSALRRHCIRVLGPSFTVVVQVQPGQRVVDEGAYRWVRQPAYLAGLVMMLGFGLATTRLAAAGLMLAVALVIYLRRIRVEEAALAATLGEDWHRYAARRKRLLPGLY